jgi:hypothetical protein
MYRLKKSPPKMPLNDYILEYKRTGDEVYLSYFLHAYEYVFGKIEVQQRRTKNTARTAG